MYICTLKISINNVHEFQNSKTPKLKIPHWPSDILLILGNLLLAPYIVRRRNGAVNKSGAQGSGHVGT